MKDLYTIGSENRQSMADRQTKSPTFEELWEMQERYRSCLRLAQQYTGLPPREDQDVPF